MVEICCFQNVINVTISISKPIDCNLSKLSVTFQDSKHHSRHVIECNTAKDKLLCIKSYFSVYFYTKHSNGNRKIDITNTLLYVDHEN